MEKPTCDQVLINNDFYETLNEDWYTAYDHPIALLRAENAVRTPWIMSEIKKNFDGQVKVLDVGCGGGLLTNPLSLAGHNVSGIDVSQSSLDIARRFDISRSVNYIQANAYALPFENDSFDVVCATDVLEHVEDPLKVIQEASRVLRKDGMFFFHTFNRNPFSYLLIIKGVDWFVKNAPKNMHVYNLFIKPRELKLMCESSNLKVCSWVGLVPDISNKAFWKMLLTKEVPKEFAFRFVKSLATGYCGIAYK